MVEVMLLKKAFRYLNEIGTLNDYIIFKLLEPVPFYYPFSLDRFRVK